jgi:hypothetical protein
MNPLATLTSLALLASAPLPLAAQEADPVQAAAAKAFADRQDSTVKLTVTRKLKGKDQSFEITAVSFDGKDLLVTSLSEVESGGKGLLGNLMMMAGDDGEAEDSPLGAKAGDNGELTRIAMLRADATEAEADLVLTDAALDLAFVRVRPADATAPPMPAAPPPAKVAPALLENVLSTQRKGPDFQRAASAELLQIAALVTTPRAFYIPSQMLPGGTAVYNLAGELLGIATRVHNESVIVPVAAIAKLATTVPAKPGQPEK